MKSGGAVVVLFLALSSAAQVRTEVPFHLIDGWAILLEGTLGGVADQKMLIDTGTVPSAINVKVAKRMGLVGPVEGVSLMNRSITTQRVRVSQVRLGEIAVESLNMVTMDLERIEQALGTRIDAVIGLDVLGRRNFSIDYRRKKLIFNTVIDAAGGLTFQVKHEGGGTYVVVPLESAGESLQVLLDTGTKGLMLFQCRLKGPLKQLRSLALSSSLNAGGSDSLAEVEMHSVTVGRISREEQKALVWKTSEKDLRDFDGLLGPTALGVTKMAFDFDRHLVSFETR